MGITNYIDYAPRFSNKEAVSISKELYGIDVSVSPLPSERDQNFLLKEKKSREKYVLKISNQKEKKEVLDLQNSAMSRISSCLETFACPQICRTKDKKKIAKIINQSGSFHYVRMITYIEGVPLGEVHPHTPELLQSVGEFIARIDQALTGFSHPAAQREFYWDLQRGLKTIKKFIKYIDNSNERSLIEYFLGKFQSQGVGLVSELEKSVIHNDGNDHNILVRYKDQKSSSQKEVSGIIDFGDMVYSYTVGDIAVAAAYVMLGKEKFWNAAYHLIKGYNEVIKITDKEIEAICHLIYLRLCMSVVISAFQKRQYPDNKYLSISEKKAWVLLKKLKETTIHPLNLA
ncbi:MAG: phosphotransferase [Acidobacteriota bacterium]